VAVALLAATAWLVAGFWGSVDRRSPRVPYRSPTAGLQWVQSPAGGPRGFFRLDLASVGTPDAATLWVEADQVATAYVDGSRLNRPESSILHDVDTGADLVRGALAFDVTAALTGHGDVVGLEVVNDADRPAAFRAALVVREGDDQRAYGTRPSDWRATSDVTLTNQQVPTSGAFTEASSSDAQWAGAEAARGRTGQPAVAVPVTAMELPATAPAVTGPPAGGALHAAATMTLPPGCTEAWLRVAASGPYTVSVDGQVLAAGPGGSATFGQPSPLAPRAQPGPRVSPLTVYDVCGRLRPGTHRVSVEVAPGRLPAFYLDGFARTRRGTTSSLTPVAWRGTGGSVADAVPVSPGVLAPFERRLGALQEQPVAEWRSHALLALGLLGLAGLAVLAGVLLVGDRRAAVTAVAVGALPAAGVVLVATELRHIVDVTPPFPSTPGVLDVVLVCAATGIGAALVLLTVASARGAPDRAPDRAPARAVRDRSRPYAAAVWAFAAAWALVNCYHLGFEPVWQDELSSLAAAQGMRAHVLPMWPSGFLYWKSELYNVLIAVVGAATHDSVPWLRGVSVFWLGATIVLFGTALAPLLLPGRRLWQFAATVVFGVAPFEVAHARDIRMYQMAQFFVVLVSVLLLRAILHSTRRTVAMAMLAVVAMYLTHEETYGVLLVVPIVLCGMQGLQWVRRREWWLFGGAAVAVICAQLALAMSTHPPIFGVDQSNGPLVKWSPAPFFYLTRFFFISSAQGSSITVVSLLAVVAVVNGARRRDVLRLYVAAFWVVPVLVVSLTLPSKDTRYAFVVLPFTFVLAFCGADDLLRPVRRLAAAHVRGAGGTTMYAVLSACTVAALGLSVMGSASDLGPLLGGALHANVAQRQLDYGRADAYVVSHERPGDVVIAATSANLVGYGIGRAPDYVMPFRRGSRLLYEFEKDGRAVDTQYGAPVINDGAQFERVVDEHARVWVVVADTDIVGLLPQQQQVLRTRFTLVEEGTSVSTFVSAS
jgi:hypothetical protein